jgi:hypothetical protein
MKRGGNPKCRWRGRPGRARVYAGVRGKVVDRIEHQFEEGRLYVHVCFRDKTEINFTLGSRLVIEEAGLADVSSGDAKPIKEYVSYEG